MVSSAAADRFLSAPLLAELDAAARTAMLNVLVEDRADPGAVLLEQGHPNDHIAFLIGGTATVEKVHPDGRVETITSLTAPSVFGLTSFFRPEPPGISVKATAPVWLLTLDHPAHDLLRRADLHAAEQLALAAARVLADRFDLLIEKVARDLSHHPADHPKVTEWSNFRARLFEESKP